MVLDVSSAEFDMALRQMMFVAGGVRSLPEPYPDYGTADEFVDVTRAALIVANIMRECQHLRLPLGRSIVAVLRSASVAPRES